MCGALASAGAEKEKCPRVSVLVLPISCMPCDSESSVTASPAAGLPVVPLVTVPVMFWAAAKEARKRIQADAAMADVKGSPMVLKGHGFSRAAMILQAERL